ATVARIEASFSSLPDKPSSALSTWALYSWKRDRLKADIQPATVNRDLIALRAALTKAVEWGALASSPAAGVTPAKSDKDARIRYLSAAEEQQLRDALAERDRAKIAARGRTVPAGRTQHAKVRPLPADSF